MSDERDNFEGNGRQDAGGTAAVERPRPDAALLEDARAGMAALGGQVRKMAAMSYPAPLFNDLTERIADRAALPEKTFDWLVEECAARGLDAPSRSAFYRFFEKFLNQYQLARMARCRRSADSVATALTGGDPDEEVVRANRQITTYLADLMFDMGDMRDADPTLINAITNGVRRVTMNRFGKDVKDALIKKAEAEVALKTQQIERQRAEIEAEKRKQEKAIEEAEKAVKGGASGVDVVTRVREILGVK